MHIFMPNGGYFLYISQFYLGSMIGPTMHLVDNYMQANVFDGLQYINHNNPSWSKSITLPNIPSLKQGNIQGYTPNDISQFSNPILVLCYKGSIKISYKMKPAIVYIAARRKIKKNKRKESSCSLILTRTILNTKRNHSRILLNQ